MSALLQAGSGVLLGLAGFKPKSLGNITLSANIGDVLVEFKITKKEKVESPEIAKGAPDVAV